MEPLFTYGVKPDVHGGIHFTKDHQVGEINQKNKVERILLGTNHRGRQCDAFIMNIT